MRGPNPAVGGPAQHASGHARVREMIGIQYNADVIHLRPTVYEARPSTPQAHLSAAHAFLNAGAADAARKEIVRAIPPVGAASTGSPDVLEVAYIRALAILSGRAFDHLTDEDYGGLDHCFDLARQQPDHPCATALLIVHALLLCNGDQLRGQDVDQDRLHEAVSGLENLQPPRLGEEVRRHLGTVLGGVTQEVVDASLREDIIRNRLGKRRRQRVPLFFEPDPIRPAAMAPAAAAVGPGLTLRALAGAGAAALATLALTPVVVTRPLVLVSVLLGLAGVLGYGPGALYTVRRRTANLAFQAYCAAMALGPPAADPIAVRIREIIAVAYGLAVPPDQAAAFIVLTAAERGRLEHDLMSVYAPGFGGSAGPDGLLWLVRWNAARAAAGQSGPAAKSVTRVSLPRLVVAALSAVVLAVGGLVALGLLFTESGAAGAAVLLAVLIAGVLLPASVTWYGEERRVRDDKAELDDRATREWTAYEAECQRLQGRPRDEDMGRWLDYDKEHLRLSAMKRYKLTSADIVSHVLIAEPAEGCRRARDVNGPTRFSAYEMRMFFLTRSGVRQIDVRLDFATGAENRETRNAFRYDAIASARIEEPSVHAHGRRQVATPEGGGPADGLPRPILRQSMRITLFNGPPIDIENNFVTALPDEHRENQEALEGLAMDTSGAVAAMRTLESVAADGGDWLVRQRDRARLHSEEYRKRVGGESV